MKIKIYRKRKVKFYFKLLIQIPFIKIFLMFLNKIFQYHFSIIIIIINLIIIIIIYLINKIIAINNYNNNNNKMSMNTASY